MEFTHLNKAYPKEIYHLPKIDQMVNATTGYNWMSFLDAYLGYNQIPMNLDDHIHKALTMNYISFANLLWNKNTKMFPKQND